MDVVSMVNERVSSSILLGQMEPRMLVMQHSYFHNSIVGIRNDRSLVLVGTEYDVDFDLKMIILYIETTSDDLIACKHVKLPWKF